MTNYTNDFGITKDMILEISKATCKHMKDFKTSFIDKNKVNLSSKLISELVGKVFEAQCAKILIDKTYSKILETHFKPILGLVLENSGDLRYTSLRAKLGG